MKTWTLAAALAGAALFGLDRHVWRSLRLRSRSRAFPDDAQAAPAKPKPKAKISAGPPTVAVTVTNSRNADLVQLQAAEPGSANWKKVLGAVKSGKQASAKLSQASDCRVICTGHSPTVSRWRRPGSMFARIGRST